MFTKFGKRYTSSNNRNDSVSTELPDLIFSLCRSVKSLIFFLEKLVPCANIQIVWLVFVIELISSNWKVIATCADIQHFLQLQVCN